MMSLESLGLSPEQERLYRYLLRHPRADLETAGVELVMPGVRPVLAELRALGLVDGTLTALAPAAAIDVLVRRRIEQTQRQLTELTLVWDVLTELTEEHRGGRPVQMVEHIPEGAAVTRRIRTMLSVDPGEFAHLKVRAREASAGYDDTPFRRLLARGLRSRTLIPGHTLGDPRQEAHARSLHALGDLHRVTIEPVRHLAIVNRSVAFVQADPAQARTGGAADCQQGLVIMLADVFDGMWARARDLDDLPLSPIEQQVLHALTRHDNDEAAARSISVSVRKFRAHVADPGGRGAAPEF
ncbi:hypothetical protein ABZW11_24315 [Nonomuraea sp. NPDC004580]|uniref:hypothetical protein n=1 Tax=Nonomuraea sp. NPDC004580 TaxID=3154552 RepID=UPI0033B3DECB